MHTRESAKSGLVKKYNRGTIVLVLSVGDELSLVWQGGKTGYIENDELEFYPLKTDEELRSGVLSYRGKINAKKKIVVHMQARSKSSTLTRAVCGTYVDILSEKNGWYEVELKGLHGYVPTDSVTLN